MTGYELSIQNIVGSGNLPVEIRTDVLGEDLGGCTWTNKGAQPGLYWELESDVGADSVSVKPGADKDADGPQVTFHESGSYIIRADSREELDETNRYVLGELKELGLFDPAENDMGFSVENVVGLAVLGTDIKLRILQIELIDTDREGSNARYEPEQFPALEYTEPKYDCTFLVYGNGKIIIAGADSIEETESSIDSFYERMQQAQGIDL